MAQPRPDGKRWSHREVSRAAAGHGFRISYSYVQSMESGAQKNPTLEVLRGLAAVFDVPVSHFYEDDQDEVEKALDALHRAGADVILARGQGRLSPEALQAIADALNTED